MKKLVFFFFSSLIVFAVTIYFRLGGHKPVEVSLTDYPELSIVYKEHVGPYHKINDVIVAVENWATINKLNCRRTFGEYLDDPRTVDERRLRSRGGCVVDGLAPEAASQLNLTDGLQYQLLIAKKYVIAKFTGAPSISPFKVYPKVEQFMVEHNIKPVGSIIEIYTFNSANEALTEYLFAYE